MAELQNTEIRKQYEDAIAEEFEESGQVVLISIDEEWGRMENIIQAVTEKNNTRKITQKKRRNGGIRNVYQKRRRIKNKSITNRMRRQRILQRTEKQDQTNI